MGQRANGHLIIPIDQGIIGDDRLHAEPGEIFAGLKPGRVADDGVTLSVGGSGSAGRGR